MPKSILVTGAAGFIGSHVLEALVGRGDDASGLDNMNDYYDPARKRSNLQEVREAVGEGALHFIEGDVRDRALVQELFRQKSFDVVVHLAAMPGVGASVKDPYLYYDINLLGTLSLLDAMVGKRSTAPSVPKLVFASTSSVYGATETIPFVETDSCDRPLAPYPASKRAAELLTFTYHHLYGLACINLRLFTVYGPRNRPDMMAFKLADGIFTSREVPLYNDGMMHRDWTYVSDIVEGILAAIDTPLEFETLNLGRGEPVLLADFVRGIEEVLGQSSRVSKAPMPSTDIPYTLADISRARSLIGYDPKVSVDEGIASFLAWYERAIAHSKTSSE